MMQAIVNDLRAQGLRPFHLPIGVLEPGADGGCVLCNTCNSFPCRLGAKSDAEVCAVIPATAFPNVTLWTGALARRLLTNPAGTRVEAVEIERAGAVVRVEAPTIVVACGAVNSAALLLRSATDRHPRGLANSSDLVGRRYMAHLATMMQGFHPFRRNDTMFQKTVALNDFYFEGPDTPFRSATCSRRGARTASWPRPWATRSSPASRSAPTTPGWRAASTGWRCRKTCRIPRTASRSRPTAASASSTSRTTCAPTICSSPRPRAC
jgi:choline dehydrogenase-like flavoprotein